MKREILIFIGGFAIGGCSIGIGVYHYTKKKYEDIVNKELEKLRSDAIRVVSKEHMVVKMPTEEEIKEEENALKELADISKERVEPVNYAAFSKLKKDENNVLEIEEPDGEDNYEASRLYPVEDEAKIPYVIDEDEIEPDYDIVCLTYYEGDKALADDVSTEIVLPEDTISVELLDQFVCSDLDQIYICKESHSTVYEVTRYSGSYSREILGLPNDYGGNENGGEFDTW